MRPFTADFVIVVGGDFEKRLRRDHAGSGTLRNAARLAFGEWLVGLRPTGPNPLGLVCEGNRTV